MDIEARRLLHDLDVPVLYAPHAPVVAGDQLCPWSAAVDTLGRFWPFVIAADDLQVIYRDYVMWLDAVLGLPVSQAVVALVRKRRGPKEQPPKMFTSTREVQGTRNGPGAQTVYEGNADGTSSDTMSGAVGQEWTAAPGFDTRTLAPLPAGEPARVTAVRSGLAAR
jgi:hypothetical protein